MEYNRPAVAQRQRERNGEMERGEQFVPLAASGDGRDQDCDPRTHTHIHKVVMMRPFPPSSPDPHLTANEKHDNYPQLFSPRPSAAVILAQI